MGRNKGSKAIKPTIKLLIVSEAIKDRQIPRRALAVELVSKIENMGEIAPNEDTIERMISNARNHEPNPLDKPWHISTSDVFNIPPEALPAVIKVWAGLSSENKMFTIRMAKWVVRLYATLQDKSINDLITMVLHYASGELITEVAKIEWDSRLLDYWLYTIMIGKNSYELLHRLSKDEFKDAIPSRSRIEEILKKYWSGGGKINERLNKAINS